MFNYLSKVDIGHYFYNNYQEWEYQPLPIKDFTLYSITYVFFVGWQSYLNSQIYILREVKWFVCGHTADT